MIAPDIPKNENERLEILRTYGMEDVHVDPSLDRITQLAANIFHVSIALVSLVEEARQVFAARLGTDICETDRESSFCAYALEQRTILQVPDALHDPRFVNNRLVIGPPFIRFYAGCPLIAPSGHVLGALCIIDVKPRALLSVEEQTNLHDLAALVMDKLELRRLDLAWQASPVRFERLADAAPDAIICVDERAKITYWNPAAARLLGFMREAMIHVSVDELAPEHNVSKILALVSDDSSLASSQTAEIELTSAAGVRVLVEVSTSVWRDGSQASFCMVLRDVTARRLNEERLYRLAHIDVLTGLPNRTLFRDRVEECLLSGDEGGLFMIDLDGFKDVNDRFGHPAGDAMLVATAQRLQAAVPTSATAARMGGDEFAVVLPGMFDSNQLAITADGIIASISQPVMLESEAVVIGASIGITRFPSDGQVVRELLSNADLALYEVKEHGKHSKRFFTARLRDVAKAKQAYQMELLRALNDGEWVLFYEPIVRLIDGALVGAEAQLRWQHPKQGLLSPSMFASALQTSPFGSRVGQWMMVTACRQLAQWRAVCPHFRLTLTVLDAQFRAGDLGDRVRECLASEGLPSSALELEITEAILLQQDVQTTSVLMDLHRQGIAIALADYGTGRASFQLLKKAPITRVKIDPVFVHGMFNSSVDAAIVRIIIYLSKSIGLAVSAKGVTSEIQIRQLLKKGCEEAQGGLIGAPSMAETFRVRGNA